jgi:hypothetical protein
MPLQDVGVKPVDAQARHGVAVEADHPAPLGFLDGDVGYHVARVDRRELRAGAGVQRTDQVLRRAQPVVVAAQRLLDAGEVARRQVFEMLIDDAQRQRAGGRGRQAIELQRQAFPGVARTDARRVEVLQMAQGDGELLQERLAHLVVVGDQQATSSSSGLRQVAVVIQGFDQETDQRPLAIGQLGHRHLRPEVLAQGDRRGLRLAAVHVVIVGIALAMAAGKVHAPAFVVAALRFLALVAFGCRNGLRCCHGIARRSQAEQRRLTRIVAFQQGIFLQGLVDFRV